jgi:protein phosphatase
VIRFVPANAQHIGTRQNQQDSFGFSDLSDERFLAHGGFVAIVADGMGGLAHGDAASRLAVKTFLETYAAKPETEPLPQAMERALRAANSAVFDMAVGAGAPGDVGTTLVAVAMQPEGLHWVSVGDSAIYLFRDGALTLLTTSHIYAHQLDARAGRGEITPEQAQGDPQRDALTSYVGAPELREIDRNLRPLPIRPGDCILLASDGLFKTLPESEILATVASEGERAPDLLVRKTLACKREHQDNVTVCMVRVQEDTPRTMVLPPARQETPPVRQEAPVVPQEAAPATWQPAEQPVESRRVSRPRRLLFLLAAVILFGAAASFIGWVLVREPRPPNDPVEAQTDPSGASEPRAVTPVAPGSVEPVLKDDPNAPVPPPRDQRPETPNPPAAQQSGGGGQAPASKEPQR